MEILKKINKYFKAGKSVGIDISDESIEAVELNKNGSLIYVSKAGRYVLEPGIVERGRIKNTDKLKDAFINCLLNASPSAIEAGTAYFSFPESIVYTHIFELPEYKPQELEDLIKKESTISIPIKEEDIIYSYKILDSSKRKEALLIATNSILFNEWKTFFKSLSIEIPFIDVEALSLLRGLYKDVLKKAVCVVDIGEISTLIMIVDSSGLHYSYSMPVAGKIFTEEISRMSDISFSEAEARKKEKGLLDTDSSVFLILLKALSVIIKEINTASRIVSEKSGIKVEEILIIGGSAQLKGIADYFRANLEKEVRLGISPYITDKSEKAIKDKDSYYFYTGAIGTALNEWKKSDIALPK